MKYPISYGADTFCVVGVATPTASTPTAVQYDKLIMVLICERRGGTILDGATLDSLSPDTWRAHWSKEGVNYYLSNFDGASEEAITAAAELLMGQN